MLKTIFFDIGNVLIFFSHSQMFLKIAHCTGIPLERVKQILLDQKVLMSYESGEINSAQVYQIFQKDPPRFFTPQDLLNAASDIFTPNIPIWPIVEELKEQGYRLILLSNTSEGHFNHISTHYSILELFDDKVLSFEVGALKPNPKIFHKALSKAFCDPKECFYIDDIPEFIASAQKEGLDGELFTDVSALKKALFNRGVSLQR